LHGVCRNFFQNGIIKKITLGVAAAIVLTVMGTGTYRQASYWKNGYTLFTHAIEVTQNNYIAHNNRGSAYVKLGHPQEAIEDLNQAIRIKPDYAEAHYALGIAYLVTGDKGLALEEYKILKTLDAEQANKLVTLIGQ
jgi:tetratricopeptide (TPR) repeat protein